MNYRVELSPHARKSLNKIPRNDFLKIDPIISSLKENPRPHGVKKLKGSLYRVRMGDWRIIYLILDEEKVVSVLDIVRRSKSTYKDL